MTTSSKAMAADKNGTAAFKGISQHFKEEPLIWASRNVMIHLASPLISQMGISEETMQPLKFLDLACGTGIATDVVQRRVPREVLEKSGFLGTDSSETMTDVAKKRIELEGWVNTTIEVKDALKMNLASDSFTHIASALALHMIPDPDFIVKDAIRMLKPGGVFGATTFSAANGTQWFVPDLDSAFQSLNIGLSSISPVKMQIHDSGTWTDAKWIESQLTKLGLVDVVVKETPGSYHFASADQWITTFGGMARWQMSEKWDEEAKSTVSAEEMIEKVREHLVEKYNGQGWDVQFTTIVMTGKAPS